MKNVLIIVSLLTFIYLQGCAAPGSAIGRVGIRGQVSPIEHADLKVRVTLDKHYGLGGLDHYFGEPEDYGHTDKICMLSIDRNGRFKGPYLDVVYHIIFFFLPPLGVFPKEPPKPYFYLEFSNRKDELYLVGESKNGFDYRTYKISTNNEISKEQAFWRISSGKFIKQKDEELDGWILELEIDKNTSTASTRTAYRRPVGRCVPLNSAEN